MKKFYGPSVSAGLSEQRTLDAAAGLLLDALVHRPGASPGTVRKWRRQLARRAENDRAENERLKAVT